MKHKTQKNNLNQNR